MKNYLLGLLFIHSIIQASKMSKFPKPTPNNPMPIPASDQLPPIYPQSNQQSPPTDEDYELELSDDEYEISDFEDEHEDDGAMQ